MLEFGIALLPRLVVLAVLVETGDREPRPIRRSLTCLRIESRGKEKVFREDSTIDLQSMLGDTTLIHPQAETLVANELHNPERFIDRSKLGVASAQLVLIDQH